MNVEQIRAEYIDHMGDKRLLAVPVEKKENA